MLSDIYLILNYIILYPFKIFELVASKWVGLKSQVNKFQFHWMDFRIPDVSKNWTPQNSKTPWFCIIEVNRQNITKHALPAVQYLHAKLPWHPNVLPLWNSAEAHHQELQFMRSATVGHDEGSQSADQEPEPEIYSVGHMELTSLWTVFYGYCTCKFSKLLRS